jgi:DNA invertase Pin-like site-specific DNA recombinase
LTRRHRRPKLLRAGLPDLVRDRVKSGLASARTRGVKLGRQIGQRPSDKKAKRVLGTHADGLSYRLIAGNVGLSKNTVMDIVRRNSARLINSRQGYKPILCAP